MVVVRRAAGGIETRPLTETPEPMTSPAPIAEPVVPSTALYEEVPEDQSFAEMFEQAAKRDLPARKAYRVGEKVSGKIFQLGADTAFISLGGKSEAMIELRELMDDEGILRFGVGDEIEAHVVEAGAKGIILSRQLSKGAASVAMLAEARLSGMPVEGLVLSVNKGGLEVAVGDVRAFCPAGQVDVRFSGKLDSWVGEKLRFRVMEVRDRNVVLSRRALLEEEQKVLGEKTRKELAEGKVVKGTVVSVRDFGVFVDLGGLEGMIPLAELSHVRVGHPSEVVKPGDEVEVEVLRIEAPNLNSPDKAKHKERISLSLRSRQEDPFKLALAEIQEGARVKGKVVRLQPFGAFVELRPGVDGLIHVSAMSDRRIAHPRDVVKVGDEVEVAVEKIDVAEKRIGLRLVVNGEPVGGTVTAAPESRSESAPRPRVGQLVTAAVDRVEPFGVFVTFPGGRGLIPGSETGTERGTDLKRVFSAGQELKAQILDVDDSGKVRLSITAAQRAEERADMDAWKQSQPKGGGVRGFGTFADLLKGRKL
jgi:small subunit ribosomal protein S1